MPNSQQDPKNGTSTEDRRRAGDDRRSSRPELADLEPRLTAVEELARADRREVERQFHQIAKIQVDIDRLLQRSASDGVSVVEGTTAREPRRETTPGVATSVAADRK